MKRLDQRREDKLQPRRMKTCQQALEELGFTVSVVDHTQLQFKFNGDTVRLWPYSGWHTGKSIQDGRGFASLLKQLSEKQ